MNDLQKIKALPEKERLKFYDKMLNYYNVSGLIELTEEQEIFYYENVYKKEQEKV